MVPAVASRLGLVLLLLVLVSGEGHCGARGGRDRVHIASRVMGLARPNEVLVSSTVKDLVAGAEIRFEDRRVQSLRGVPGHRQLFAAFT